MTWTSIINTLDFYHRKFLIQAVNNSKMPYITQKKLRIMRENVTYMGATIMTKHYHIS